MTSPSYMILAPALMKKAKEDNDAAKVCLEAIELDPEKFRMGHTKVASTPCASQAWDPSLQLWDPACC